MSFEEQVFMDGWTEGATGAQKTMGRGRLYQVGYEAGLSARSSAKRTFDGVLALVDVEATAKRRRART